jgi:phosphate starvation-inducible protein PhoH and related proteins
MTKRNRRNDCDEFFQQDRNYSPSPSVKKFALKYLNLKQKEYGATIRQNTIIFAIGSAGSGKTFLAALHAMDDYLAGRVEKIVVCRPVVNAGGEDLGFLPGTLQEKMDPYIKPIFDAFAIQWNPKQIQTMLEYGKIEIAPLAYMRGRTFRDAFIICDEAQNATDDQLLMLLSRLGENSKLIITGDPSQRDISGRPFEKARHRLGRIPGIAFVDFSDEDVVRHPLVQRILRAWRPTSEPEPIELAEDVGILPNFISARPNGHLVNGSGDD